MDIAKLHKEWASTVTPHGAPQVQRQEMERAFYAGFFAALSWQLSDVASLPDAEAERKMQAAYDEAENYFRTLGKAPVDTRRN